MPAKTVFTKEDLPEKYHPYFCNFDKNEDGKVSRAELVKFMKEVNLQQKMDFYGVTVDDFSAKPRTREEYQKFGRFIYVLVNQYMVDKNEIDIEKMEKVIAIPLGIRQLIEVCDYDNSGAILQSELITCLEEHNA